MTEIKAPQPAPLSETVASALRRAFNLGQTYWQQADSESYSQNAKSDITRSKFDALVEETTAAVAAIPAPEGQDALALAHRIAWRYKKSSDPAHSDTYTFNEATLLQFVAALAAHPATVKQDLTVAAQPSALRNKLQAIVDGATPNEGGLTASLRAVAADELAARQAPAEGDELAAVHPDQAREELWGLLMPMAIIRELTGTQHQDGYATVEAVRSALNVQPKHTADHVPVSAEVEAATDDKLGLVLLPPIRVDRATYATLMESAKATGQIIQAVVRDRLAPYAMPSPAPAPEAPPENLPTKEHIRELAQEALDQIMEQAQVFASAWSLVGGKFDDGNGLSDAEDAKAELRTMVRSLADLAAETVRPAQAPAVQDGWQPIETAPKDGRKLILAYRNRNDKARTVMARWVTDDEAAETDADGVGLEGGWYECIDNWDEYSQVTIHEGEPSHWMPLPAAPGFDVPVHGTGEQP